MMVSVVFYRVAGLLWEGSSLLSGVIVVADLMNNVQCKCQQAH